MKTKISRYAWGPTFFLLTILFACTPPPQAPEIREERQPPPQDVKAGAGSGTAALANTSQSAQMPVRFQTPSYTIGNAQNIENVLGSDEEFVVKVGADITSTSGSVALRDIVKKLAALKNMNVSWASDVDQYSYVDVDIRADDDFFKSIDNLLRQRDYFHEVQGNTIVIKYKETRQFHLAMPFVKSKYDASVGSKISENSQSKIDNSGNTFDIWENVQKNLDIVLQIWENSNVSQTAPPLNTDGKSPTNSPATAPSPALNSTPAVTPEQPSAPTKISRPQSAKGYYTIDKPIGLITVTAPRPIMEKVEVYLNNLKAELYKQVSIEAKFIEVTVTDSSKVGIDWKNFLDSASAAGLGVTVNNGVPIGGTGIRSLSVTVPNFSLLIDALELQGSTKVLANPRVSVLNGQPALLNVGTQTTYVKKVTQTVSEGIVTVTVETGTQGEGIMMSVVPTIMDNDEIILNLIPVTSSSNFEHSINLAGVQAALPITNVQELSTIVRIKQGETLVIGGLIESEGNNSDKGVPILSKIPFIGRLFGVADKSNSRRELVILLKPVIIL